MPELRHGTVELRASVEPHVRVGQALARQCVLLLLLAAQEGTWEW